MWCPRHDRTYARRATCPDCRTPLVRIDPPQPRASTSAPVFADDVVPAHAAAVVLSDDDEAQTEPARDGPQARARRSYRAPVTVALAIATAFAMGVALPDTPIEADPRAGSATTPNDTVEHHPYTVSAIAGVALRLERFEQAGQRVEIRFRVLRGFHAPTLRDVFLDLVLDDGRQIEVPDVSVHAGHTRFTTVFLLPDASTRVRHVRVTSLRTASDEAPLRLVSSVAGAWPVEPGATPRIVPAGATATTGSLRVRWVSTILWSDRVEVVLDLSSFAGDARRSFGYAELFEHDGTAEPLPAGFAGVRNDGDRVHLDFVGVRSDARRLILFLGQPTTMLDGPWTWALGRRSVRSSPSTATDSCGADLRRQRHPCP